MKTSICALDEGVVAAPISKVWHILADVPGYALWWPASLRLRVLGKGLVGAEVEINPPNGRPFRCRVRAVEPPISMTMEYLGFVRGTGHWRLQPEDEGTRVQYALNTEADGWLVRILSFFVDLGAVHSKQMQGVLEGLKRRAQEES